MCTRQRPVASLQIFSPDKRVGVGKHATLNPP
jgi:hypothetical protein